MRKYSIAAVIAIAITAVILCFNSCEDKGEKNIVLCYSDTDEIIESFEVDEGSEFSVEFIHSVNQSPVKDVFRIENGQIVAARTIYSAFGAGVQTEIEDGQTLEFDEDGNMVVSGFDIVFPRVDYLVGTVSDHILEIQGESISLRDMCGRNAHVYFEVRSKK
ncbi:MAG: DUF1850 domain-containing protein [Clostridia bacterium]|nr:DUF1850 domain-containing protein [Clostridia bacterium]